MSSLIFGYNDAPGGSSVVHSTRMCLIVAADVFVRLGQGNDFHMRSLVHVVPLSR